MTNQGVDESTGELPTLLKEKLGHVNPGAWQPTNFEEIADIGHGTMVIGHPGFLAWIESSEEHLDLFRKEATGWLDHDAGFVSNLIKVGLIDEIDQ